MPTYEYECTQCGKVFELFQPITEPPRRRLKKGDPQPCNCHAAVKRRIGTGAGIIFKGSGFYETDYRSESYKKGAKAEKEAREGKSTSKESDTKGASGKSDNGGDKKSTTTKKQDPKQT